MRGPEEHRFCGTYIFLRTTAQRKSHAWHEHERVGEFTTVGRGAESHPRLHSKYSASRQHLQEKESQGINSLSLSLCPLLIPQQNPTDQDTGSVAPDGFMKPGRPDSDASNRQKPGSVDEAGDHCLQARDGTADTAGRTLVALPRRRNAPNSCNPWVAVDPVTGTNHDSSKNRACIVPSLFLLPSRIGLYSFCEGYLLFVIQHL